MNLSVRKNALANLVRGGATAAVALVLPRFLTRSLDAAHFSAWSLILQIAAYASYLDFGLQLAVARFIAQAVELEEKERQAKLISTTLLMLGAAALIAFCLVSVLVCLFPGLFQGIPYGLLPDFRRAALALSLSACLLLPLSTYTGVLIGLRRNEIPAVAIGGSRIVGALAAIVAAHHTQSLTQLALCVAIPNVLGGLSQMVAVRALMAEGRARFRHVSRSVGRELLRFCAGLAIWSFAMLLVSGLDVTIVGHFDFAAVGFYSLASMLITFVAGLTNAALSSLMAPVAALHARGERIRIADIVLTATRMTVLVNIAMTALVFLWGGVVVRAWVGPFYAARALPILEILSVAQTIRLAFAPYALMLISVGEQSKNIAGAVCEAIANLFASIVGMFLLGAIGVAWGTLLGAICGTLWMILRTLPSVSEVRLKSGDFVRRGILSGIFPCLPLVLGCCFKDWYLRDHRPNLIFELALGICVTASALLAGWTVQQARRPNALRPVL